MNRCGEQYHGCCDEWDRADKELTALKLQVDGLQKEGGKLHAEVAVWKMLAKDAERLNGEMLVAIKEAVVLLHEKPRDAAVARLMAVLSKTEKRFPLVPKHSHVFDSYNNTDPNETRIICRECGFIKEQ